MGEKEFWVTSGYGIKYRKPFVSIHYQDTVIQVGPDKAREIAGMLLEAAEASDQDAFLFEFAKKTIGVDDAGAAGLLNEFRLYRKEQSKNQGEET